MNPKASFDLNSDLNSPFQCVWEGSPSLGLGGFGDGVAQRTLFLGVDKVLIWKTSIFLFNKLHCDHFLEGE